MKRMMKKGTSLRLVGVALGLVLLSGESLAQAVYYLNQARYPCIAYNINKYLRAHPGAVFTRQTHPGTIDANRLAACGGPIRDLVSAKNAATRYTNDLVSCDEFPFASSDHTGAVVRTASTTVVLNVENNHAGANLQSFYATIPPTREFIIRFYGIAPAVTLTRESGFDVCLAPSAVSDASNSYKAPGGGAGSPILIE